MTDNEGVLEIGNKEEFENFISGGIVLVDFFADWCMPCLMMAPVIDDLSETFGGKIKFAKVNIDDNSDIARKFHVSSIPNFVVFKDGEPIEQFVGAISSEEFENKLNKLIE
ncbi:MAG: thioredoxin [Nanoarchaeota archaeon]|nr:thioredoxin [Nanoarchaeota archaeon]